MQRIKIPPSSISISKPLSSVPFSFPIQKWGNGWRYRGTLLINSKRPYPASFWFGPCFFCSVVKGNRSSTTGISPLLPSHKFTPSFIHPTSIWHAPFGSFAVPLHSHFPSIPSDKTFTLLAYTLTSVLLLYALGRTFPRSIPSFISFLSPDQAPITAPIPSSFSPSILGRIVPFSALECAKYGRLLTWMGEGKLWHSGNSQPPRASN